MPSLSQPTKTYISEIGENNTSIFSPEERLKILALTKEYNRPTRFILTILDPYHEPIYEFDCWKALKQKPEFLVDYLTFTESFDQTGSFEFSFADPEHNIDMTKIHGGCWVKIKGGRDPSYLEDFHYGMIDEKNGIRERMEGQTFDVSGLGSQVKLTQLFADFEKIANVDPFTNAIDKTNSDLFANNLMIDLYENETILRGLDQSVRDIGNYDTSLLYDSPVNDFVGSLSHINKDIHSIAKSIAFIAIAQHRINAKNQVVFDYGNNKHSGVILKQFKSSEKASDYGRYTSYFHGLWNYADRMKPSLGFANMFITESGVVPNTNFIITPSSKFMNLWNKDICQQIPVTSSILRFNCYLSKKSDGSPSRNQLRGAVLADKNGLPDKVLTTFKIDMRTIPQDTPTWINVALTFNTATIQNLSVVWVALYEVGDSDLRTINVYHDDIYESGSGRYPSAIRSLPNGRNNNNPDEASVSGWELINGGNSPMFGISTYENTRFKMILRDQYSINLNGVVQTPLDVAWANDIITTGKFGNAVLSFASKRRLDYQFGEVFIPLDYYFNVGDLFTIIDDVSDHTVKKGLMLQVNQRKMTWNAKTNRNGIHFMSILPSTYHNPLLDEIDLENVCEA